MLPSTAPRITAPSEPRPSEPSDAFSVGALVVVVVAMALTAVVVVVLVVVVMVVVVVVSVVVLVVAAATSQLRVRLLSALGMASHTLAASADPVSSVHVVSKACVPSTHADQPVTVS